jgi:hypothetical protein
VVQNQRTWFERRPPAATEYATNCGLEASKYQNCCSVRREEPRFEWILTAEASIFTGFSMAAVWPGERVASQIRRSDIRGTGFSLRGFAISTIKIHRLKPALLKRGGGFQARYSRAIKSISTRTFLGRRATSTVERAGGWVTKKRA